MKCLFVLFFVFSSFSQAAEYNGSSFKGYVEINKVIFERVRSPYAITELGSYLQETYTPFPFSSGLLHLLGYIAFGQNNGEMTNGTPNPMNTLLYHILFDRLTKDMADHCTTIDDPATKANYQENFYEHLKSLCLLPIEETPSDSLIFSIWNTLMGFDAPQSEFIAWKEYIDNTTFSNSEDRVYKLMYPVFMNPYYLIQN